MHRFYRFYRFYRLQGANATFGQFGQFGENIKQLTGENWEGTQRHNKHMDFIYRVAAADVDPAPPGENTSDTAIDKIKDLVRRVSVGEISPMLAEHYLRPLMVLIDLTELQEVKAMLIKANLNLDKQQ